MDLRTNEKERCCYPYDYMDAEEKFAEKRLPEREDFYSLLTDEDISDEEYGHAQKFWDTFGIENMCQYHDLYLKSDVLLLADVFQNLSRLLWFGSLSLYLLTRIILGCYVENDKGQLGFNLRC